MAFEYIKSFYNVHPEIGMRVLINGRPGTIVEDRGNYLGVRYDGSRKDNILSCHPTWEVTYIGEKS